MSSTFPLPLECLQIIIRCLAVQCAYKSVATLLCVNKYVCAATLPILYQDPFDMRYLRSEFGNHVKSRSIALAFKMLAQVLLRSLPLSSSSSPSADVDGLVTEMLRAVYFQDQDQGVIEAAADSAETSEQGEKAKAITATKTPLPTTLLPYSSYMTRISLEEVSMRHRRLRFTLGTLLQQPDFQGFLKRTGRADQYYTEDCLMRYGLGLTMEHCFTANSAEREMRRDLTWALCISNVERIQILHIPLSDIGRYLALVSRFKVLAEMVFQMDRALEISSQRLQGLDAEKRERLARLKQDRARHLEEMILFVQEHQRHHPNVLRTAWCASERALPHKFPEEYKVRLLKSLPPLVRPQILDDRNWDQFLAHIAGTNVSFVQEINSIWNLSQLLRQEPTFLRRCRSLESVSMMVSPEDTFKWAVQERKELDDAAVVAATATHGGGVVVAPNQRSLVPLRDYSVLDSLVPSGRQANDVIYAFNKTLESIKVICQNFESSSDFVLDGRIDDDEEVGEDAAVSFSSSSFSPSGPNLPRLRSIYISAGQMCLRVHPALFAQSPSLVNVNLGDRHSRHSLADTVVYWGPVELPSLTELTLTGTPAISFHPETLKSTRNLVRLDLSVNDDQNTAPAFIFASEGNHHDASAVAVDQDQADTISNIPHGIPSTCSTTTCLLQPVWTWDWHLPKLTHLYLNSKFAHMFQFRMLDGTPSLIHLSLDIQSRSGGDRTIEMKDLLKPEFQHPLLSQFLERDRHLCEKRRQVISYRAEDDESCKQQQQEEDEDRYGDEKLWREEFEFIHCPCLLKISLTGLWVVNYRVLKALFSKVAPRIANLRFQHCKGFTIPELVQSTTESLHELQMCYAAMIPFNLERVLEAGLVDDGNNHWSELRRDRLMVFEMADQPAGRVLDTPAKYLFH